MKKRAGKSYIKRVADVNRIYDQNIKSGLSNREIWKRYVYPVYGISERTFYNVLKASPETAKELMEEGFLFPEILDKDERRDPDYFKKNP
jgi:predicted urease superfamily metal-dependent hydrolase